MAPRSAASGRRHGPVVRVGAAAAVAFGLGVVAACFTAPRAAARAHRSGSAIARAASEEVYMPDASPKGKQVVEAYNKLKDVKDEKQIEEIVNALEPEQRTRLKSLIELRGGAEREITNIDPELGDTPERLYRKLLILPDDNAVLEWRKKIEPRMMQNVQEIIEKEQKKSAEAEDALSLDDDEDAQECYDIWSRQFPKPAETEQYMGTPCRVIDIKYRFRRMKENLGLDSATVLQIVEKDGAPFIVDPDYIRRTWKALVAECGDDRADALENLVLKHPGSLIANPSNLKGQINQAKISAALIDATSGLNRFIRNTVTKNGQNVPIGRRDEAAFGGGFPAWKRKWEEEDRERKEKEEKEAR